LPQSNSYEAERTLQRAWDNVDIYTHVATRCKRMAKTLYAGMLIIAAATTILTTVALNRGADTYIRRELDTYVMVLTLTGSALVTVLSFFNPQAKWHQLRGTALALESEVWKFRTRTGLYSQTSSVADNSNVRGPEGNLMRICDDLSSHVLKSASVVDTAFYARFDGLFERPKDPTKYHHGQHSGSLTGGTYGHSGHDQAKAAEHEETHIDDHHSPITPAQYIELRVKPQLEFYQGRLPYYSWSRTATEGLLLAASLTGTILAFAEYGAYAAIATATSAAVISWSKFSVADKKLQRYSDTIAGISSTLLWWRALTDVEQANTSLIAEFVLGCEDLFQSERQSWVTTALSNSKMLLAQQNANANQEQAAKKSE